jgi:hypothetical protein
MRLFSDNFAILWLEKLQKQICKIACPKRIGNHKSWVVSTLVLDKSIIKVQCKEEAIQCHVFQKPLSRFVTEFSLKGGNFSKYVVCFLACKFQYVPNRGRWDGCPMQSELRFLDDILAHDRFLSLADICSKTSSLRSLYSTWARQHWE